MRFALLLAVLVACKGEPFRPDAQIDGPPIDAYDPPWFFPEPGEVKNWDIQIAAPYDLTTQRAMMVVDLWDFASATMIDYGDGMPVSVPAGPQAGKIAMLKSMGTVVLCHVGTGAMKLTDPDAMKFPGYEANPPDRPTAVKPGSSIGWSTSLTVATERFVDFRNATAAKVLAKRIELAKTIGCGGIVAYRNDAWLFTDASFTHGFSTITPFQETEWIGRVAKQAHDIEISAGGRGGHAAANVGEIADDYDWLMAERCTEVPDCDLARPFIEAKRAVFGLDYDTDEAGTPNTKSTTCTRWRDALVDGVIKKAALDGSFRDGC